MLCCKAVAIALIALAITNYFGAVYVRIHTSRSSSRNGLRIFIVYVCDRACANVCIRTRKLIRGARTRIIYNVMTIIRTIYKYIRMKEYRTKMISLKLPLAAQYIRKEKHFAAHGGAAR